MEAPHTCVGGSSGNGQVPGERAWVPERIICAMSSMTSSMKSILVTGGNAGIGLALCRQLAVDHGCHVFMGARNADRGALGVRQIVGAHPEVAGRVECIALDVADDAGEHDEKTAKAAMSAPPCIKALDIVCAMPREQLALLVYCVLFHLWAFAKWLHC